MALFEVELEVKVSGNHMVMFQVELPAARDPVTVEDYK